MDDTDRTLIATLRRDARASISEIADAVGVTRATVRARLARLEAGGEIVGYTVVTRGDDAPLAVRGVTMIAVEGKGTEAVIGRLLGMAHIQSLHTTNGRWDIIIEIGAQTLPELDALLRDIRVIDGVASSETSLYLSTRRSVKTRSR
ncbi:MAG: Lrp/AsnC family transcriptional regulator [Pseudomonadota bacterium]